MSKSAEKHRNLAVSGTDADSTYTDTDKLASGVFKLEPISGSQDRRTIDVDVDLTTTDGSLLIGDVRRAAERATSADQHEVAHRIWTVLIEAARRVGNVPLEALSVSRADGAKTQAKNAGRGGSPAPAPSSAYAYDYEALAADRADGMKQAEVAKEWNCSPGTVARAVRYVNKRDELVSDHPELLDDVHSGATVKDLATTYGVSTKVMRWIVTTSLDRRNS